MKTLKEVKAELRECYQMAESETNKARKVKYLKRINFLILIKMYLETKPDKDFLENQLKVLINRWDLIYKGMPPIALKSELNKYNSIWGVADLKNKIKALQFILNK